jgi:hypothetical protein
MPYIGRVEVPFLGSYRSNTMNYVMIVLLLFINSSVIIRAQEPAFCTGDLRQQCQQCLAADPSVVAFNCSLPGLESFTPGQYAGMSVNYLSFVTNISSPSMPIRALQFEQCTGATIVISEANNVFEDPVQDLGSLTAKGGEVYDGYFMSYSHVPEVSALDLAEHLNDRIRTDNDRLKWEDAFPKVRAMGEYRKDGVTNIDFLSYDGDFFVPLIRLDLLEQYDFAMPNTWDELLVIAKFFHGKDLNPITACVTSPDWEPGIGTGGSQKSSIRRGPPPIRPGASTKGFSLTRKHLPHALAKAYAVLPHCGRICGSTEKDPVTGHDSKRVGVPSVTVHRVVGREPFSTVSAVQWRIH